MAAWTGDYAAINGQVLDGMDADGTKWGITDVTGWGGSSDPTLDLTQRIRQSGAWGGESFGGPRSVAISGWCRTPSHDTLSFAGDRLTAAVSRAPVRLDVSESSRLRWQMVQRSQAVIFTAKRRAYAEWSIQVKAKDWRKFGAPLTASTHLPSSTGGLTIPFQLPTPINAVTVSGPASLTNPGNEIGPVALRVDGPCPGPIITHRGSGRQLVFGSNLVLLAGEWLDVDMEKHTALLNGQASRSGFITNRGWSGFEPGENVWAFTAAGYAAGALLTVTATPADE